MNTGRRLMAWLRLAVLALSVFAPDAFALVPVGNTCEVHAGNGTASGHFPTCAQAAEAIKHLYPAPQNVSCTNVYPDTDVSHCKISGFNVGTVGYAPGACPANSVAVTGGCQCNAGFDESGGQCVPHVNACTANQGKPFVLRVTIGYSRTPDDNDTKAVGPTFNPWAGAPVCSGGCSMQFSGVESAWVSQSPNAQGLYRNSVDATYINSGQECTSSPGNSADQAVNPSAAQPPCPGYVGEVNGKLGCYGTAASPVTSTTKPTGIPQPPVRAGNPPAGERPASGEGSASQPTPAAGNGGPAGGPAGAAVGGRGGTGGGTPSGSSTVASPTPGEEQAACGAPGQPVCAVKVDETGMPTGGGEGMGLGKLNEQMDKLQEGLGTVTDKSGMDTSWGGVPTWFNSVSCTPWNLGTLPIINRAVVINHCAMEPYAVAVMSFLWVVGTFFAILGMVGRVTAAGVH